MPVISRLKSHWRTTALTVLGVGVAAVALAISLRGVDRAELAAVVAGANWWWIALAALVNAVNIVAQGWAWHIGLRAGGSGDVAVRHCVGATWVGKAGNQLLPGKVGELARIALIRVHLPAEGREITRIVGSLVAQRVLYMTAALAVLMLGATAVPDQGVLPGGGWTVLAVVAGVTGAALAFRAWGPRRNRDGAGRGRLARLAATFASGAGVLRPCRDTAAAFALHLVGVLAQLVMLSCLLRGFDVSAPITAPLVIILLVGLVGAVPGAPGGAGLNQAALVAPLGAVYGIDPASAFAFALGLQVTLATVAGAGGLLALAHHRMSVGSLSLRVRS